MPICGTGGNLPGSDVGPTRQPVGIGESGFRYDADLHALDPWPAPCLFYESYGGLHAHEAPTLALPEDDLGRGTGQGPEEGSVLHVRPGTLGRSLRRQHIAGDPAVDLRPRPRPLAPG